MSGNLVIVESPAKAKTIEKFLGKDFKVVSSFGHIRDLSKKNIGIDIKNGFTPEYIIPDEKKKVVAGLRKSSREVSTIWLASDEDREGEAIAWHLMKVLDLSDDVTKRIVFHEITKEAIEAAINNPRSVNMDLVNAQQARRVLDRLVGFEISPILWKKVQPALSAGRVQSVAVRLLVEREREIISFLPVSSFRIQGDFIFRTSNGTEGLLKAEASQKFNDNNDGEEFLRLCSSALFRVSDIVVKPGSKSPAPPFTTSTLQQEAYRKLGFPVAQTMAVAQKLYESGRITYMRTDSTNLSQMAINTTAKLIISEFGDKYSRPRQYKTRTKGAQEAHEAIRPTYIETSEVGGAGNEKRLYELIWKRTIASQMSNAEIERTTITIGMSNTSIPFLAHGEVIKFDGFLKVYRESTDTNGENGDSSLIPPVTRGMSLSYDMITATEKYTTPPPRYTEASLVKRMEELGIGRPSTYAPVISTIQNRGYVVKENRTGEKRRIRLIVLKEGALKRSEKNELFGAEKSKLFPKDIGIIVNDFLVENFKDIFDYHFTANIEIQFDEIADGKLSWSDMLEKFYEPFHIRVTDTLNKSERKTAERKLGYDQNTGKPVYVKMGKFGPVARLGDVSEDEKPKFASLLKGQLIETITLDEAIALFRLPRTLGEFENRELVVGTGRFGPYVRHDDKFYSLKKDIDDPYSITLEKAIELVLGKREEDKNKVINTFGEIVILKGRYGPYISYRKNNYKIPRGADPLSLTEEECMKIIEKGNNKKKS